jgi:hypothetical protein
MTNIGSNTGAAQEVIEGDVPMIDHVDDATTEQQETVDLTGNTAMDVDTAGSASEPDGLAGRKGKGKGTLRAKEKGKGKGKGKRNEEGEGEGNVLVGTSAQDVVAADGEDNSDLDQYQAPTAEVDSMDGICARALFTYARIDLFHPPLEVIFGKWNTREEVDSKARELAKAIVDQKFRPFASDSLLPLVLDKSAIEPSSIYTTANVEDAPMLQLTEAAVQSGMGLTFAGGRHRRRAAQIIKEASMEKAKKYQEEIDEQKKKLEKVKPGSVAADTITKRVRMREAQITMENDIQNKIGIWGVAVYDRGESKTHRWT